VADGKDSAERQIPVRSGFLVRAVSALVLIPVAVLVVYLGGWILAAFVTLAGAFILHEWNSITLGQVDRSLFALEVVILVVTLLLVLYPLGSGILPAVLIVGLGVVSTVVVAARRKHPPVWAVAGLCYALVPGVAFLWVRQQDEMGFALCLWTLAIVWATDIGAYAVGKTVGGPRLAPRLSPNKTWAGLVGGVVFAGIVSPALGVLLGLPYAWSPLAAVAGALAVWEQAGDLLESALKRRFHVKDSGSLIPGHGGIMDRVDGFVFVMPVVAAGVYLFGA